MINRRGLERSKKTERMLEAVEEENKRSEEKTQVKCNMLRRNGKKFA